MTSKAYDTDRQMNGQTLAHGLVSTRLIAWLLTQIVPTIVQTDTYSSAC